MRAIVWKVSNRMSVVVGRATTATTHSFEMYKSYISIHIHIDKKVWRILNDDSSLEFLDSYIYKVVVIIYGHCERP